MTRLLLLICLIFSQGLFLSVTRSCQAVGGEFSLSGSDLNLDVNAIWAGGGNGGYYPIRVRIRNLGPERTITLECQQAPGHKLPLVTKNITIAQNAMAVTTLFIPLVSSDEMSTFRVLENGRPLKGLQSDIIFPTVSGGVRIPSLLLASPRIEDHAKFDEASNALYKSSSSSYSYSYYSNESAVIVSPSSLPENWIGYSSLGILAIPFPNFEKTLTPQTRQAILRWVESGGALLVYEVKNNSSFDNLLGLSQRRFVGDSWKTLNRSTFSPVVVTDPDDSSVSKPEILNPKESWPESEQLTAHRNFGLGQVIRLEFNPFPGSVSHWSWLLKECDNQSTFDLADRYEISSRKGNESFIYFPIPGVGNVPVMAFLTLITLFCVVIGPLNYWYFQKKKQLAMLLVTVPVLSFGSSLLLLGYSTISSGFSVKSRVRSITVLDQAQKSSLSISRVAFFAGMAPSKGLSFSPDTAVFPIWPTQESYQSARIDWTEGQRLQTGWLRSRTRTQFLVVSQNDQRGRLDWKKQGTGAEVANGLEWGLDKLFVVDDEGKLWYAKQVAAGASVVMQAATDKECSELRNLIYDNNISQTFDGTSPGTSYHQRRSNSYGGYTDFQYEFYDRPYERSLQEEVLISQFGKLQPSDPDKKRRYYAVLSESPGIETGLSQTVDIRSFHLLLGFLE